MSNQLLLTYSVLDSEYKNGSVQFISGLQDAAAVTPNVGTINNPANSGVTIKPTDPDPKMFSYAYNGTVRMLVSKVVTPVSNAAPYTSWSLYEATPTVPSTGWTVLAKDIALYTEPNKQAATNSYGVAHVGDYLYIVDYDSQKIYALGTDELSGLPTGSFHELDKFLDLGALATNPLPSTAKGQAIIALTNGSTPYLFALYTNPLDAYATQYGSSILVRMTIDATTGATTGTPIYDAQCALGMNSQEIIPLTETDENGDETVSLVIPSVGGQQQAGTTSNGLNSMIQSVLAFDTDIPWEPTTLVTGAASGTYDIFAISAPDRAASATEDPVVYILTYDYAADYLTTNWKLYETTVTTLLSMTGGTLSAAVTAGDLVSKDSATGTPGYFWDILMETGDTAANDRLWFFQGSALLVTLPTVYTPSASPNAANKFFGVGTCAGKIGGTNVDWADLTIETVRQAALGKSLKRSVRASKPPAAAAAEGEEK
ncbi:MAG: hypothetical protein LBK61_06765 [Spirochaetaceae bacterium]|jgi:hypothetical protein|nr:hypothetical protein [Spirochaetaceae bacterium]